jgi:hypothetical protein
MPSSVALKNAGSRLVYENIDADPVRSRPGELRSAPAPHTEKSKTRQTSLGRPDRLGRASADYAGLPQVAVLAADDGLMLTCVERGSGASGPTFDDVGASSALICHVPHAS